MKKQIIEKLEQAVKDWISYDLPPAEKAALNDTLLEALRKRFDEIKSEESQPVKPTPPPIPEPFVVKPKPKLAEKPKLKIAKKHK